MTVLQAERRLPANLASPEVLVANGMLPISLFERGKSTRLLQAPLREVRRVFKESLGLPLVLLQVGKEKVQRYAVVRKIVKDPASNRPTLMELQEVSERDTVRLSVPIVPSGAPAPVLSNKASLETMQRHITIQAAVANVPERIEIDVSGLDVDQELRAGEIALPEGVKLATPEDTVIFGVHG